MALCHHSSGFLLTSLLLFLDAYCESIRMERPLVDPHGGDLVLVFLLVLGQCGMGFLIIVEMPDPRPMHHIA
jgi:hypothetical protein